ncbi:hypothetical protein [Streptomyces sp. NPDC087859]|uniref:hypothetical protein n=1 Tax=Streptomyces sp. NPDC087859 TaxID=3365812 RepID=UPI00382F9A17
MAELTSRREYDVDVDFGGFALQDADDRHVPVRFPEGFQRGTLLAALPSSGQLRQRSVAGGPMPDRIPLADHSSTWSVRVVCTGRAAMAEYDEEDLAEGIEQYLAQFWPAA